MTSILATRVAAFCALGLICQSAHAALDLNLDLELGRPRPPVVVQPAPHPGMRWVPEHFIRKEEQVVVAPGRSERREERVIVERERVERIPQQVLVKPATLERQWVPPVIEEVDVGPIRVKKTKREGFFREVQVPAVYETTYREVRTPPRYEVRIVEAPVPPRYETITRDVVVPGHWEEVTVVPPPVVVPGRPRTGIDLDLEFGKRR